MTTLAYQRVLLKVSGEGLGDDAGQGIGPDRLAALGEEIRKVVELGVQVGIVVGGGNFVRGATLAECGLSRALCDRVGMLATVMNGMLLTHVLEAAGIPARHLSAAGVAAGLSVAGAAELEAVFDAGEVAVLSGGTGNPYFTTDSAGALRAREAGADVLVKATKVDGVYSADPAKDEGAELLPRLSYDEVLERRLGVMDLAAVELCREADLPILVCNLFTADNLVRLVRGEAVGTRIGNDENRTR